MNSLLRYFGNMMLLRANPQDGPVSSVLQAQLVAAYIVSSILASLPAWGASQSVIRTLLDLGILFAFIHLLLRQRRERIHQTLNGILGVSIAFALMSGALAFFFSPQDGAEASSNPASLLFFVLLIWLVMVYGHILRQALEITFGGATLLAFLYIIASTFLVLSISSLLGF